MRYPLALQNLIDRLAILPSVGQKTAERYAFHLLNQSEERLEALALAIKELKQKTTVCHSCLAISESSPCAICADTNRNKASLCVVENSQDLNAIESTKQFNGLYFVLGGLINTIEDVGPETLNINKLIKRIQAEDIKELILALNFTLEGETTALYLGKILKNRIKITRLAKGLPAGSDLEYADETTLSNALKFRNEVK
ncbi:MAG: recombination protein RecR [Candidatus Falkowbacteria bacterium]|nr:MAG: recombination protein RecR [Candidatus Falkowbacteria bacterium]